MKIKHIFNKNSIAITNDKTFEATSKDPTFGVRHLQCFLLFFGIAISYAMRVNLSVAIVAMTDKATANPNYNEYPWNEKTKSLILSSFFWGYIVTQIPAGQLAKRYGAKVVLLSGIFMCSVLALLTPICADIGGWQLVFAIRVVQGLCQGVVFPGTHTLIAKWAPVEERSSLGTYAYTGVQCGTVIMMGISGVLASSSMGWPSVFYFPGGFGILWSIVWFIWGASSPSEYKSISIEEKTYIETSQGLTGTEFEHGEKGEQQRIPWLDIFTSIPFLVILVSHLTHNWGYWTLLTQIPTYLKNILDMNITSNALISALPYTASFIMSYIFLALWTVSQKRNCFPLSVGRKIFNAIGTWIPMIALTCLAFVDKSEKVLTIVLLVIAVGINVGISFGFLINHIDLSPNFSGILMGITNCAANVTSIFAPLVVGIVVTDEKNPDQWHIVFFIAAGFYFFGNFFFLFCGKTEVQSWNEPKPSAKSARRNSQQIESQHEL